VRNRVAHAPRAAAAGPQAEIYASCTTGAHEGNESPVFTGDFSIMALADIPMRGGQHAEVAGTSGSDAAASPGGDFTPQVLRGILGACGLPSTGRNY